MPEATPVWRSLHAADGRTAERSQGARSASIRPFRKRARHRPLRLRLKRLLRGQPGQIGDAEALCVDQPVRADKGDVQRVRTGREATRSDRAA